MNKIKILYDVFKTMKSKEVFNGTLTAEAVKGQKKVFSIDNTFEKNNKTGFKKVTTNSEVDCEGKKIKLQNSLEFQGDECKGHMCFMKHLHAHHNGNSGVKDCFGKITFALGVLNSIKVLEQEDKSVILSLQHADMSEDLKAAFCEHMKECCDNHKCMDEENCKHKFMKEFHGVEKTDFNFKVFVNSKSEIEKISIEVDGVKKDENNENCDVKLFAEANFNW
ncbi:hypothetical protein [Acetivibrio cellulolyticus]|uniref:hypothetical protein n=1 Tax=Acetivibrio cellulolyticus TaxID=35830 RepID=UPI0001E2C6BB|nr:hypothetical protein [Acetivibrio cellulolyticus]